MSIFPRLVFLDSNREFAMPLAFEIGAGTRRAGKAEVVRIQQDPRVTSKP